LLFVANRTKYVMGVFQVVGIYICVSRKQVMSR